MPDLVATLLQPDDCTGLSETHRLCFSPGWSDDSLRDMFRAHAAWGYGCRENTVWTSFVIALPGVDDTEIATIATHPDHQGQGLAGYLLQKVISVAALRGANRLLLEVAEDNLPARSLYTRHGFVIDGRRRNYYRRTETHCVDAILMSVDLKPPH